MLDLVNSLDSVNMFCLRYKGILGKVFLNFIFKKIQFTGQYVIPYLLSSIWNRI